MNGAVSRLRATDLILCPCYLGLTVLHGGLRLGHIVLHFRNLQDRKKLSLLHAVTDVDINLLDIPGDFGHQLDFLIRFELRGEDQVV